MTISAVLFDVDGTLVDSNYHHALAWARAFRRHGHVVPLWRIHRCIGMGGDRLVPAQQQRGSRVRQLRVLGSGQARVRGPVEVDGDL